MYAMCPDCGDTIEDTGDYKFIACTGCGRRIRSRVYGGSGKRSDITSSRAREPEERSYVSPFHAVFGFFCTLSVATVIIVIFINFISFFPALTITAPALVDEHQLCIKTKVPIIIDAAPPIINLANNGTIEVYPGQIIELDLEVIENNLMNIFCTLSGLNLTTYRFIYDAVTNTHHTTLQAPAGPGQYQLSIVAIDYAGNVAKLKVNLQVRNEIRPYIMFTAAESLTVINSTTDMRFKPLTDEISNITYSLDQTPAGTTLMPNGVLPVAGWFDGLHELNITMNSNSDMAYYLNTTILVDNMAPKFTKVIKEPLTINREDTFRNRLNETVFYRGEFVEISAIVDEENPTGAQVVLNDRTYEMVRMTPDQAGTNSAITDQDNNIYQSIISLPKKPGKYTLELITTDIAGNICSTTQDLYVTRIRFDYVDVPIIQLQPEPQDGLNLPLVNASKRLAFTTNQGDVIELDYEYIDDNGTQSKSIEVDPTGTILISDLPGQSGEFVIRAKINYQPWDYLFFTIPIPPFLFGIPMAMTGWTLLIFYLIIALSIILSNMYLLKTSFKDSVNEIKDALFKMKKPLIESRNSIIMLTQLFITVFSFSVIFNYILAWNQVETHTPDFSSLSNWALIYNLTSAAVYEEFISRILLIGIPLLIFHTIIKKKRKPLKNYLLGGGFNINKSTLFLIFFSSLTFGLAHAPGWDYWKVIPSFVSGLVLGYLFVVKGVYLSILLHFTINFLLIPIQLADYPLGPSIIFSLVIFFWILIGVVFMGYYLTKIIELLKNRTDTPRANTKV